MGALREGFDAVRRGVDSLSARANVPVHTVAHTAEAAPPAMASGKRYISVRTLAAVRQSTLPAPMPANDADRSSGFQKIGDVAPPSSDVQIPAAPRIPGKSA